MIAPSPQPVRSPPVTELLAHAIDYAGLYPPAALSMRDAVLEYHAQRSGPHAWALGRFVVGIDQLDEFIAARRPLSGGAWPLSLLVKSDALPTEPSGSADVLSVEAYEVKASTSGEIHTLRPLQARVPELYVEIPSGTELESLLAALRALGARAKIRTGGVTADAIPSAESVARFLRACVDADVRFKATAGLHHLLRGEYPLTYAPSSPQGTLFGFLNVFVAAALATRGIAVDVLVQVLEERQPQAFRSAGELLCWREHCLTPEEVRRARRAGVAAFGSCSFSEPMAELASSGLMDTQ